MLARAFLGSLHRGEHRRLPDVRPWEALAIVPIAATCVLLGIAPRVALDAMDPALDALFALVTRAP